MKCPYCGKEIEGEDIKFCPHCGKEIENIQKEPVSESPEAIKKTNSEYVKPPKTKGSITSFAALIFALFTIISLLILKLYPINLILYITISLLAITFILSFIPIFQNTRALPKIKSLFTLFIAIAIVFVLILNPFSSKYENNTTAITSNKQSLEKIYFNKVIKAIDYTDPYTRNNLLAIIPHENNATPILQAADIFKAIRDHWTYVNDPQGGEYFAKASETIYNGFKGDCDDFAVVIAAAALDVGLYPRITLAYGEQGGHAYTEIGFFVPKGEDEELKNLGTPPPYFIKETLNEHFTGWLARLLGVSNVSTIYYRKEVWDSLIIYWLNMDWWANYPGGEYFQSSHRIIIYPLDSTYTVEKGPMDNVWKY